MPALGWSAGNSSSRTSAEPWILARGFRISWERLRAIRRQCSAAAAARAGSSGGGYVDAAGSDHADRGVEVDFDLLRIDGEALVAGAVFGSGAEGERHAAGEGDAVGAVLAVDGEAAVEAGHVAHGDGVASAGSRTRGDACTRTGIGVGKGQGHFLVDRGVGAGGDVQSSGVLDILRVRRGPRTASQGDVAAIRCG